MGYCCQNISKELFLNGFERTHSRGPDDMRIVDTTEGLLGFQRLSIMGLDSHGMQPFQKAGHYVVCNGEIYGFRSIKNQLMEEGFEFEGESDCEILLPLYIKMGVQMFQYLDGEFAMIIFDGKTKEFIAARDPIGIKPLFYGYDEEQNIIFASECKNLIDICQKIYPFPPGHYYKNRKFVCYRDMSLVEEFHNDDLETICHHIHDLLVKGIEKRLDADAPLGFLLSGGLDSSLVCSISSRLLNKPIQTFAIGMEKDAIDLKYAKEVADFIHSQHTEVIITKDDVIQSLEDVIYTLGTYDITTIRASIGMYLLCQYIHQHTDIRVLLTGAISDELFGYKYTDFAPHAMEFQKESEKRIQELYMYDVLRADRCISVHSLEARVPFGDLAFVDYVMHIDPAKKMNVYGKGKYLLRKAFDEGYLPEDILMREKAAFSDAVGHSLVDELKAYAESYYSDEEYEAKKQMYDFAVPFTKESLLYREIFEKYYPHQAHMIQGFWMPNSKWEGCQVLDPSARFLKNYGNSGK